MGALPSALVTGVEAVDREHERLFALVEKLSDACGYPDDVKCEDCPVLPRECYKRAINHLDAFVYSIMTHFLKEEQLMDCLDRREAEAHKRDHAAISAVLVRLSKDTELENVNLAPRMIKQIALDYLGKHVITHDNVLASSLKLTGG